MMLRSLIHVHVHGIQVSYRIVSYRSVGNFYTTMLRFHSDEANTAAAAAAAAFYTARLWIPTKQLTALRIYAAHNGTGRGRLFNLYRT